MNRRKKITNILKKKDKKANRRNIITNKPRYVSKADREAEERLEGAAEATSTETTQEINNQ